MATITTETYTYIGGGESSPEVINFMGKQEFVLGEETEVTNMDVLKKIKGNMSFVKGSVERAVISEQKKEAKKKADARREDDKLVNARALKQRK